MNYTIKSGNDETSSITVTFKCNVGTQSFLFNHGDVLEYWDNDIVIGVTEKNLRKIGNLLKALSESDGKMSTETRFYIKGISGWINRRQRDEVEVMSTFMNNSIVRLYFKIKEDEDADRTA